MRWLLKLAAVLALLATMAGGAFYMAFIRPFEQKLAPATPQNARVELLAGDPDALILMPFVTGDVPRLVRGDTLRRHGPELWFTNTTDAGNVIGAVLFTLGSLPPVRDIATAYRERSPIAEHTCLTIGCMHWPTQQQEMWGMGRLNGLGNALGPAVERRQETFKDHATYLKAHAAVAADPARWFAQVSGPTPQPPPTGLRKMTVSLPTRVVVARTGTGMPPPDAALETELAALARALLGGTEGKFLGTFGTVAMPIWAEQNGRLLLDAGGGSRALPDLALVSPGLHLDVPEKDIGTVSQRVRALPFLPPDQAKIDAAVARAFRAWSLDTTCLPACAGYQPATPIATSTEVSTAAAPFWTLDYWIVPVLAAR
jgi:hypothetical protein